MKYLLALLLLVSVQSFAQEKTAVKPISEVENKKPEGVPFAIIERVPVYKGCNEKANSSELKKCMSDKINRHIAQHFNTELGDSLDIPNGYARIYVSFKIDKEGNVTDANARASHKELEAEGVRVVNLIPKMASPGMQRGKPVIVSFTLPIQFKINKPEKKALSKKELRRLRRKKRG